LAAREPLHDNSLLNTFGKRKVVPTNRVERLTY
jgi:hypothetical protein